MRSYVRPFVHIPLEITRLTGISNDDVSHAPRLLDIEPLIRKAVGRRIIVGHNIGYDMEMLAAGGILLANQAVDTLALARRKHPMGPNSLDALCRRYGIDNGHRTKHGALLDSELLAEVYVELIGGKQAALVLDIVSASAGTAQTATVEIVLQARPAPLAPRLSDAEREAHERMIESLGEQALWRRIAAE